MTRIVLVVDDSPTDTQNLKNLLEKAGYQVVVAHSGAEAITKVKAEKPDMVIMDVVMPGVNGFQATRMISKDPETCNIPIIVVSSKNQETDRMWALRQGAKDYVMKPVVEAELLDKVKAALVH